MAEYDQIVDGTAIPALQSFAGTELSAEHVDPGVQPFRIRGPFGGAPSGNCEALHAELRERAKMSLATWAMQKDRAHTQQAAPPCMSTSSPEPPRITVLMPVYDGGRYLSEALESILRQSFGDFELLIVDDGSTDETPEILVSYATRDPRIVVRRA